MVDKVMRVKEIIAQIRDGDSIVIGGWGPVRKPMALVREIAKSDLKDLTILTLGALDLDLLIGAGKVKKAIYPFMSLEGAPGSLGNFRQARQTGAIEVMELSEYMFMAGFKASAERLPFFPTRSGLGTDILTMNPQIEVFESPYTKEKLVAMPALTADVALIHVNAADSLGNGQILGNPFMDTLLVKGAKKVFLSAERVISATQLKDDFRSVEILGPWITGVVEIPYGAHPGSCYPEYGWDESHLRRYGEASASREGFEDYLNKYVRGVKEGAEYTELVGGTKRLSQLKA